MTTATDFLNRYEPRRRPFEIGFWLIYFLLNAAANSLTVLQDVERRALDVAAWEAITWESSSALAALLLILPIVWLTARFPLDWRHWRSLLLIHAIGTVVYTLAHVGLMVSLREMVYAVMGGNYDFGHWPRELAYEYLKDARSYLGLVLMIESYRFVLRRLRGEARWPDPSERCIDEAIERPERFLRVHRSHAVRIDALAQIRPGEHGDAALLLHSGQTLPCSKAFRHRLNERLVSGINEGEGLNQTVD